MRRSSCAAITPRAAMPAGAPSSSRMRRARRKTAAAPLTASESTAVRTTARHASPACAAACPKRAPSSPHSSGAIAASRTCANAAAP
eukprot:2195934-Pleurochrysis_carterae.AAC.2